MSVEKLPLALSQEELNADLPPVCLCCGAPATVTKPKGFWRQPPIRYVPSIGIIGLVRLLMQVSEAASMGQHLLRAPFCEKHANYWLGHKYLLLARLGMVGLFIGGLVGAAILALAVGPGFAIAWAVLCVLALFAAAGLTIFLQLGRVEQMEPNPDFLLLSNVSKGFCDALASLNPGRQAEGAGLFTADKLASMQQRQGMWQIIGILVLPVFAALALTCVSGVLALVGPPSGLPQPAGGPATRANDLHCYELLMRRDVSHEARSWLRWHSSDAVEGWDRATTVNAVDRLYALGAQKVYYHPVILLVVLPKDPEARKRIFEWEFANVKKNQGQPTPDEQQSYLLIAPK